MPSIYAKQIYLFKYKANILQIDETVVSLEPMQFQYIASLQVIS